MESLLIISNFFNRKTRINIAVEVHVLVTPVHRKVRKLTVSDLRWLYYVSSKIFPKYKMFQIFLQLHRFVAYIV